MAQEQFIRFHAGFALTHPLMDAEAQKRAAAARALEIVQGGMRLGLGTGSTAKHFVDLLGERVRAGLDVVAVPTSETTGAQAAQAGISLTTLDETPELDLTVDGADEIAPDLTLIKGGGGALLREKIVAAASARMVVIADNQNGYRCSAIFRCRLKSRRSVLLRRAVRSKQQPPKPAVRDRWLCGSPQRTRLCDRQWTFDSGCPVATHSRSAGSSLRCFARFPA